ncbi:hypothetical protein CHS0354_005873 [Potamilus streckersoni]|uniref:Guanine deaminase n=1 Tax=Potamilus streckersoni TaxID=2493646 RepID=A0AAE0T911_9BIVA|nr:hypothetical protein CHS0354_005873 [Potamilus streckersoni]
MDYRGESQNRLAFCGNFVHATKEEPLVIRQKCCLGVVDGKIVFFETMDNLEARLEEFMIPKENVTNLKKGQFILPGFVDTHIHAPQYPNAGKGLDLELLDWLQKYTFPAEARYKDQTFANNAYESVVNRVIQNGTTTACYFATIHTDATLLLCDIIHKTGQRALVGKVNMNTNSPDFYIEEKDESLTETERFIGSVLYKKYPLITPVITPRFSGSCDRKLLKQLADLGKKYKLPVQSHISENKKEVEYVKKLFPECKNYTDTYYTAGLLTNRTILAHGIYLSSEELFLIKAMGTSLSHCPNSNISIKSGLLDVRGILDLGIKVGLGTDVSGGYSPSMLDAMRSAIHISKTLGIQKGDDYNSIDHKEAFMMATLGGCEALGLEEKVGNFVVGKEFDALLIDVNVVGSPLDVFKEDTFEDVVQKFMYLGDDRNIVAVFVAGRLVCDKRRPESAVE